MAYAHLMQNHELRIAVRENVRQAMRENDWQSLALHMELFFKFGEEEVEVASRRCGRVASTLDLSFQEGKR